MSKIATDTYPIGSRVRGHHFRQGVVTGHASKSGLPIVRFNGDVRGYATHPGQLITEAAYQAVVFHAGA